MVEKIGFQLNVMDNLLEGVKVIIDKGVSVKDRIYLSAGTTKPIGLSPTGFSFCDYAYLPSLPWRIPTNKENHILLKTEGAISPDSSIKILKIPNRVIEPLSNLGLSSIKTEQDLINFTHTANYKSAIEKTIDYIKSFLIKPDKLAIHSVTYNPPKLTTVTFDYEANCYIGLHLDSWDKMPLSKRHLSQNRLCINLGREDRHLLFINLSLSQMAEILGFENAEEINKVEIHPDIVGYKFIEKYPKYPVTKLRIKPYEAYIAPTENIMHDGSTIEINNLDLHLTMRGYFDVTQ